MGYDLEEDTWDSANDKVKGMGANIGEATGIAKLPDDPTFQVGDILVANMTIPENVPVMRKASAIATNIGSITCHAAIVAREMGKPCVVSAKGVTDTAGRTVTVSVKSIKEAEVRWET